MLTASLFQNAGYYLAAGLHQPFDTPSGYLRVGICQTHINFWDAVTQDKICAGWSFSVMITGFQGDIETCSGQETFIGYRGNRIYFGMRPAIGAGPALPDNAVVMNQNRSYHGVGCGIAQGICPKLNGSLHVNFVYLHPSKSSILALNIDDLTIRPIERSDNPQLAALIRSILEDLGVPKVGSAYADESLDSLFEYYQAPGSAYYVVLSGSTVLGGAGFAPLPREEADVCELQKMYFHPTLRGRGLSKPLLAKCLDQARSLGYRQCYLETMPYMEVAQAVYRKFGFDYLPAPMGDTGHHSCQVWMRLDLTKAGNQP